MAASDRTTARREYAFSRALSRNLKLPSLALLIALLLNAGFAGQALAARDNKYAALVVDPNRQLVLYEQNAESERYPASLTKVMTLYLTFEALKNNKLKWSTKLPVSARAAAQPQTNIYLKAGQRIAVRDLVESLIVRSANDAAVVLAEGLGRTEWEFARMMTHKARALGMRKTTFRNASGLHDPGQKTTAQDMVRLALATKKHFPEYFHLFNLSKFAYNGRTYFSHNRVTRFYRGANGMKTGYVRASGFNLITTAKRGDNEIVAVVLGGQSSKSRDSHMIALLDNAFSTLGRRDGFFEHFASYVPRPLAAKPDAGSANFASAFEAIEVPVEEIITAQALANSEEEGEGDRSDAADMEAISAADIAEEKAEILASANPAPARISKNTNGRQWGIQVGTFTDARHAMRAAANALDIASENLNGAVIRVANFGEGRTKLHRAHLANLTEAQARQACRQLNAVKESCFVFKTSAQSGAL